MGNFFEWFFVFISEILKGFASIFKGFWEGIKQIFNIKNYITIFKAHSSGFGVLEWILAILSIILVIGIFLLIIFMIVLAVRKYIRFRHSLVSDEDLLEEIGVLQRQVLKMTKEKDEIMAMKVAQMSGGAITSGAFPAGTLSLGEGQEGEQPQGEEQTQEGVVITTVKRFSKLIEVDNCYKTYTPPEYDNTISLSFI